MLVDVQVHHEGDWTIVAIVGELDLAVAPRVRQVVGGALAPAAGDAGAPRVVLDLGSVHFVDSSGLGVVLGILRRIRQADGVLRVVVTEPQVLGLFELLGLDAIVELRSSVADALAAPVLAARSASVAGTGGRTGG